MNQVLSILCLLSLSCSLSAQRIEVYGGLNRQSHEYHRDQDLSGGIIGFGFSPVVLDNFDIRITGSLNSYHGTVWGGSGGALASSSFVYHIKNYDFGIGVYPFNVKIIKHIHLNIGTELKILIIDQTTGRRSSYTVGNPGGTSTPIGKDGIDIFPTLNLGVIGRIGYEIKITDAFSVLPQYSVYIGLTSTFMNPGSGTSLRQYFCLGVLHTLK